MAGIGLINLDLDAKTVEPIVIIGLAAFAGYFMWKHLTAQDQAASAAQTSSDVAIGGLDYSTGDLENLALMQQLGLIGQGTTPSAQPVYSAPGSPPTATGTTNTTGGTSTTAQSGTGTNGAQGGIGLDWSLFQPQGASVGGVTTGNGVG